MDHLKKNDNNNLEKIFFSKDDKWCSSIHNSFIKYNMMKWGKKKKT